MISDGTRSGRPSVTRWNASLDDHSYQDISDGEGEGSGDAPTVLLDGTNKKLLVTTNNAGRGNRPSLFRCESDGTKCHHHEGRPVSSERLAVAAVIDEVNQNLVVVEEVPTKIVVTTLGLW